MQPILPRWLLWLLCSFLLAFVFLLRADHASPNEWWRNRECRFQTLQRGTWTAREEQLTARCVVGRWPVEGGIAKFMSVGACESGWNRLASNGGNYLGLFQHSSTYWPNRVRGYDPPSWDLNPSPWNSRSQITVTARMAHGNGWSAWSCA
jgi:hypothetical protein